MRPAVLALLVMSALVGAATRDAAAHAQTPAPPPAASAGGSWEVAGYGGAIVSRASSSSTITLPSPGAPILTSSPTFPSRQIPSWLVGDGANLLNGAMAAFQLPGRLTPLDAAFAAGHAGNGVAGGVRLRRRLTDTFSVEAALDLLPGSAQGSGALASAGAATRDSFKSAFAALLATGPFTNVAVDATSTTAGGAGLDLAVTGAVRWHFGSTTAAWRPFATLGGGVVTGAGSLPSVTVQAHYAFSILSQVPIDETDRATLHDSRSATLVGLFGGGLRRRWSDSWAIDIEARIFVGANNSRLLLDATPTSVTGTPAGFIESFTNPNVQFSNNASTGRQSTLSAPPLRDSVVVSGNGLQWRVILTAGLSRRF